jgi:hypothetical protein
MFTLPLSSARLAALPMLYGSIVSAAMWVMIAALPLRAVGLKVPIAWPAAAAAAFCVWLQVISWVPFWFRLARVGAAVIGLCVIVALGAVGFMMGVSEATLVVMYLGIVAVAFPLAAGGLARARRGDGSTSPWAARSLRADRPAPTRRPFASPQSAQFWYELRRNVFMLPAFTILSGLAVTICHLIANRGTYAGLFIHNVEITSWMMVLASTLLSPLFSAMFMNGVLGKADAWLPPITIPSFFAARPISTTQIVAVKFKAAALSMAICWIAALIITGVWSVMPHSYDRTHTVAQIILRHTTPRSAAVVLAVLVFVMFSSWRSIADSFYIYFYGRKWFSIALPLAFMLLFTGAGICLPWILARPNAIAVIRRLLPWAVYSLLLLKFVLGVLTLVILDRHHLIPVRRGVVMAGVWLVAAILVATALIASVPPVRSAWLLLACAVGLYLPAVRLLVAPLALHYNRHR